jgi:hypothetical protein
MKGFKGFNKMAAIGNAAPANLWIIPGSLNVADASTVVYQSLAGRGSTQMPGVRDQRSHRRASFTDGNL